MNISKEFKIGLFVIIVLLMTFAVVNFFRGSDILNRDLDIYATIEDVDGLRASAQVLVKGYPAGSVRSVEYNTKTGGFDIICSIKKEFNVPTDSKLYITGVDIMGTKGVKLQLGSSDVNLEDGGSLECLILPDMMSELSSSIGPLLAQVTNTISRLDTIAINLNEVLSAENKQYIANSVENLSKTMENVEHLSTTINGKSNELEFFVENLGELSSKLLVIGEKADTTITNISDITETLTKADIEGLLSSFHSLLENVQDPDGSLGKLMKDDGIYNSVDSLLLDINGLVEKIKDNPKKYIKISVF